MVGMKMGETTKWSNIALDRIPLKLQASSIPNVNSTMPNNGTDEQMPTETINNQTYRTELSLNIGGYSYATKRTSMVGTLLE